MKFFSRIVLLVGILVTACAPMTEDGSVSRASPTADITITTSPSPTAMAAETPTPSPVITKTLAPTPTALYLPTRAIEEPPQETVESAPTQPVDEKDPPLTLLDDFLEDYELVAESEHFVYYSQGGYFPVDQEAWVRQAEAVYDYVSDQLDGANVETKIAMAFLPPDERECPVRGLALYDGTPQVILYADENSPQEYLLAVLAHELGHAIPSEGFPDGLPDELALTEGLATWASGTYWTAWINAESLDALIREHLESGTYEPLYEVYDLPGIYPWQDDAGPDCLARRDQIYGQWGAFLGYLIETYGWEKAHRLFENQVEQVGDQWIEHPPDYSAVYGKALNQLEAEWLASITE